ncbi:hypothetical protein [Sorangium sp. So ce1335]|uniref:hypothetical protein n=1 Tax=Sorangium sp. So ce1335 TaxID=3133335 RepID=UPI003F646CFA
MVESEGNSRSITLEELAAIAGALEAGVPRDEALAGAGLSVEAWEAGRERWLAKLAGQAARGQLRPSQRYLELLAEQKRRAQARVREARRKLEGPIPVAPEAHLPALGGAQPEGATPVAAAGASDEEIARSPWARPSANAPSAPPLVARPALAASAPSPLPSAMPSPVPAVTPTPWPLSIEEPPPTAPPDLVARLGARAVPLQDALPFVHDAANAAPGEMNAEQAAPRLDTTVAGAVSPFRADKALPFSRTAPAAPNDGALPFSRTAPVMPADKALPFSRTAPVMPADKALPFSQPSSPPPTDKALPFSQPSSPPPTDKALPFSRPVSPPVADGGLPFSRKSATSTADIALPFSRKSPSPPADKALPFSPPSPPPPADKVLPFSQPSPPPAPPRTSRDEAVPRPPPLPSASWALPFQQPSSGDGPPAKASPSPSATGAQAAVDAAMNRRVERISLAQYARICADVREHPAHVQEIQSHYGLDAQSWTALHARWHERFQADPALKARWQALVEQSAARR